jgi:hypothetical protein
VGGARLVAGGAERCKRTGSRRVRCDVAPGVARTGVRSARGSRCARRGGAREQVLCASARLGRGHREPARVRQWRGRARAGGAEAEQAGARVACGVDVQAQEALAKSAAGACERWVARVGAWARELGARGRRWSEWRKRVVARQMWS